MDRVVIKNGNVVDGTGNKPYQADIIVENGLIKDVGHFQDATGEEVIDASGMMVTPGFIDTHVHGDVMLLHERQAVGTLSQGVTTVITGNCGRTMAPFENKEALCNFLKYFRGTGGCPSGFRTPWLTFNEYMALFDRATAVNVACTATHGNTRMYAAGFLDIPTLKGYSLEKAKKILRSTLEDGAIGFSTGLSYFPAAYGDTQELIELCKIVAEYDVPFMVHLRTVFRDKPFDAVEEAIHIAEVTGVKLHMSHFKTGSDSAGNTEKLLHHFDKSERKNLDVSFELYPYHAGSGSMVSFLPPWVVEGGYDATLERLANSTLDNRLEDDIQPIYQLIIGDSRPVFTNLGKDKQYLGRDFYTVAAERGESIQQMIHHLLLDKELDVAFRTSEPENPDLFAKLDDDIFTLLSKHNYMVGSDSLYAGELPHPRLFGSFTKLLRMAREKSFPIEKLINRMTLTPATRFRLSRRGKIAAGMAADMAIFNFSTVTDTATFQCPRSCSDGVDFVLVNGKVAVRAGKVNGLFAGRAITLT